MKLHRALFALIAMFSFLKVSAEPLKVGDAAPAVGALSDAGTPLNLGEVYPKGYTLVYFYPKAGTPGCTAQGCSLRDAYEELTKHGVTVIGVSADTVEAQRKFKDEQGFPFTLLADTEKTVITAFGVPTRDVPLLGTLPSRQAFLVNKEGRIVWADHKASTKQQAEDVLNALKSLGG